jgi:ribulose-phosphate 3-epimerase
VEAQDDPRSVIERIHRTGRGAGLAINPETPAEAAHPYLEEIDLLLVMTVHPGFGGQAFIADVLPKLSALRAEAARRSLDLPIGVDGGVSEDTIGAAHHAGGDVLVVGSGLYRHDGDLAPVVEDLRSLARRGPVGPAVAGEASA